MSFNEFLSRLERLGKIVEASELLRGKLPDDDNIKSKKACEVAKAKYDDENRLLKIGILGRVKAGKSSFLNALLFGGEDILPTAATPKTAALTILEYAPTPSLSVEFYNEADLREVKKKADEYAKILKEKEDEIFARLEVECFRMQEKVDEKKLREKAQSEAFSELVGLETMLACYQQQQDLDKRKITKAELEKHKEIRANLDKIRARLGDFVGENGKFTPYTKCITLRLDNELLNDVQIIDTPGLDDPVQSRSDRTIAYLGEYDAVLLLSGVEKFLTKEDANLVANLAGTKDTARIFFIVSKFDRGLRNLEHAQKGFDRAFDDVLQIKKEHLNKTLKDGFGALKKEKLENVLKEELVYSSSICASIIQKNGKNSEALDKLKERFADDFKDEKRQMANLKKLANIDRLNGIFSELKASKQELFKKQVADFLNKRLAAFDTYKKDLQEVVDGRINALKNNDIKSLQERAETLMQKESGEVLFDDKWSILCQDFCLNLKQSLKTKHGEFFDGLEKEAANAEDERTETTGLISKDYHHLKEINVSAVRSALIKTIERLENLLNNESKRKVMEFRNKVEREMGKGSGLSEEIGAEFLDDITFKKCLMDVFYKKMSLPKISYEIPSFIRSVSGIIKDTHDGWIWHDYTREASNFIDEWREFSNDFRQNVKKDIERLIEELEKALKFDFGKQMFKGLADEIESIKRDLQDGVKKLDEYNSLKKEIENV